MTDTFRLAVLKELTSGIAGQVPAVADAVFRGRMSYGDNDPLPMVSILEDPRLVDTQTSNEGTGSRTNAWRLLIQGFVQDDFENPTDPAYLLAGDLQQALGTIRAAARGSGGVLDPERKTNVVERIEIGAPIVRPPDEFSAKAYCWVPVSLQMVESPTNPFT